MNRLYKGILLVFFVTLGFNIASISTYTSATDKQLVKLTPEELREIAFVIASRVQDIQQAENKLCYHWSCPYKTGQVLKAPKL